MKKNITKVLGSTLAGIIFASFLSTAQIKAATLSADELYRNAYNATVTALNTKTQLSVNNARITIEALRGTGAEWAIGEFSKQVDTVQHPILVTAVNAILVAQGNPTQVNINNARKAIDKDMPSVWRNSYSSAVDAVQQILIKNALDAYAKASQSKLLSDVKIATVKLDELRTAIDSNVVSWANTVQADVDNILNLGTLGSVNIRVNGVTLNKEIAPDSSKVNVFNITYTDGKNINSATQLYVTDMQRIYTVPAIGTAGYADVYDLLLSNISYNLYMSAAKTALNNPNLDPNTNPVSIDLSLNGNDIVYSISSGFYKTVTYTFSPTGNGNFDLK